MKNDNPIIFFDGHCNLCNTAVNFIIRRDKVDLYQFASLQGETARSMLKDQNLLDLETLVLYQHGECYTKSEAALLILNHISSLGRTLFRISGFFPRTLLDGIYDFIANNRYKIFGKRQVCRIPTETEKSKFLP